MTGKAEGIIIEDILSMFSYLAAVQEVIDEGIYARGIKAYLEGKVVSQQDLTLDYWRLYEVVGLHENNSVKIPLLHVALSQKKWNLAGKALQELASCTCEYSQEYGMCKHIVAVCAKLEQEWNPAITKPTKTSSNQVDSILDSLFAVEQEKTEREVVTALNYVLTVGNITLAELSTKLIPFARWLSQLTIRTGNDWNAKNFDEHTGFILQKIDELITTLVGDYTEEKRLVRIISSATLVEAGGVNWFSFWQQYIKKLDPQRKTETYTGLWKAHLIGATKYIQPEFSALYSQLAEEEKKNLLEIFQKEYHLQRQYWLEFVFFAKISHWVVEHAKELDPHYLIMAMEFFPEYREEWEIELEQYFRTWTDFLPTGEYHEFATMLKKWRSFGNSEYLKQAFDYVKTVHRKKRSLIKMIGEME